MNDPKKDDGHVISRRNALKAIVATGGATALATVPAKWESPLVNVGALPAYAQVSPNQYTFTNDIEDITFENDNNQLQAAAVAGWIAIAPVGTTVGSRSTETFFPPGSILPPWIISRPWLNIRRRWDIVVAPWPVAITVKIKIKFRVLPGFFEVDNVADGADIWCFGMAGNNLDLFSYYITKVKVKAKKVEISYSLPAIVSGLYPFYLSLRFPFETIPLINGNSLFSGYYVGPGCFGHRVASSFPSFLKK